MIFWKQLKNLNIFVICILIINVGNSFGEEIIVKLPNGNQLIGLQQNSLYTNKNYMEFRGIPYAQSPVGSLRFKSPVKYEEKWKEPRKSFEYGPMCPQDDPLSETPEEGDIEEIVQVTGQEDCLTISIATPSINNGERFPVAVWIHGSFFQDGSGADYGISKFMEHEMVFVTFNYRLGVLGFAASEDGSIQGNMGLKDQVLALKWIKENIESFGGDVNSITLLGVNSGAVSAHLHMLSPMSEGLFHRVILQSGVALAPWAITQNPAKVTKSFGNWLRCNENITLTDCLMNADVDQIIRKQSRFTEWFIDPLVPLGPSVETVGNEPKFLSQSPYSIISTGKFWAKDKVAIMAGVNADEGLLHSVDIAHHPMLQKVLNMEWVKALPITLLFRDTAITGHKGVADKIYTFYFEKQEENDENEEEELAEDEKAKLFIGKNQYKFQELTQMYSDRYFHIPLHHTGKLHGNYSAPVYLYWFDYVGEQSSTQLSGYNSTIFGVSHFDQIQYMFQTPYFNETTKTENIEFGKRFVDGIARFVIQGKPPLDNWVSVTPAMVEGKVPLIYNRIGISSDSHQLTEKFSRSVEFWNSLNLLENKYGIDPAYIKSLEDSNAKKDKNNSESMSSSPVDKQSSSKIEL